MRDLIEAFGHLNRWLRRSSPSIKEPKLLIEVDNDGALYDTYAKFRTELDPALMAPPIDYPGVTLVDHRAQYNFRFMGFDVVVRSRTLQRPRVWPYNAGA